MSAGIPDQRMKGQGNQGMFSPSFGQQSSYNYFPNNGDNYNNKNAWDSQQQVNGGSRRGYDDYNRGNDKQRGYGNDGVKSVEHGVQRMGLGNERDSYASKANSQSNTSAAASKEAPADTKPKKMTWATIASQPVKASQTRVLTTLKKKPGMPPPPMIPGKHNMDIGTWDSEKNGALVPPPVPSPPPVIDEPSPFQFPSKSNISSNNSNNKDNNGPNNGNGPNNASATGPHPNAPSSEHSGRSEERYRNDDRPGSYRDREPRPWHNQNRDSNGYQASNRYQPQQRNNYGAQNQDRMNYQDGNRGGYNHNNQRPQYRSNQQSYGNRNYAGNDSADDADHQPSSPPPPPPPQQKRPSNADLDEPRKMKAEVDQPPVAEKLLDKTNYNPAELDSSSFDDAKFFVIKSYSEDDVHRSIKYEIWCSTEHGNKRLDQAFRDAEREGGKIFLLFSVNGSGHFCGVAQMMSAVDYNSVSSVWHQDKWKGKFSLKWVYVKDVPNQQLRHIRLENNENKSVTHSRDTQEVPNPKGQQVMQIIHTYVHTTSIFDDMDFYEQRQNEEDTKRVDPVPLPPAHNEHDNRYGPPSHQYNRDSGRGFHRGGGGSGGSGGDEPRGFQRDDGYENRGPRPSYNRDYQGGNNFQGNNRDRGYHNANYDNRRGGDRDDYHQRGGNSFGGPRDYNNRREGFMTRDRPDNNRFEPRDRIERSDDNQSGGFKRNNSFGNRSSNGSTNANQGSFRN